jgi:hypothetical protein
MMRLRGLVCRLLVHLVPIKPIAVLQEDVCWCGIHHLGDYWHDPTHGRIDRDIQDMVTARYGDRLTLTQREAIESTVQGRRDQGLSI